MFSATVKFLAGDFATGLCMVAFLICALAIYIILTRTAGYYSTNVCIAGAIFCAIITDALWMFFVYNGYSLGALSPFVLNGMLQLGCAITIFFFAIMINNILNRKKYTGIKIFLLAVNAVCVSILTVNYFIYHYAPSPTALPTTASLIVDIAALIINAATVTLMGIFALKSVERNRSKLFAAGLLVLFMVVLTFTAVRYRVVLL